MSSARVAMWQGGTKEAEVDFVAHEARIRAHIDRVGEEAKPLISQDLAPGTFPKMTFLGKVRDRRW